MPHKASPGKSDSSLVRLLGVLDLFSDQQDSWTVEAIAQALQVSQPTGYRYVRILTDAGLLQRAADSSCSLGPRIMVLDYYMRKADSLLHQAIPFMKELVARTGFDCVLSEFFGNAVLDTHQELGPTPATLTYGRGRPRPLFRGAAPQIILSQLPSAQLRKVFDTHQPAISIAGLPAEWTTFRKYFSRIRKAGHYLSHGEVDTSVAALAVPLPYMADGTPGALTLVTSVDRMELTDQSKLLSLLAQAAADVTGRVQL